MPGSVDYDKMVRTITETVSNQMNIEINSLRSRINQLENKLEQEITKRQTLEEEVRRLKDNNNNNNNNNNNINNHSSSPSSSFSSSPSSQVSTSPQTTLPKKPNSFLRLNGETNNTNNNINNKDNTNNINNESARRSTVSDVVSHNNNNIKSNNVTIPNGNNIDEARQAMKSSDEKSGWVKAPLSREPDAKAEVVHDTVLFDTASDRTMREGSLEKMGKTRQSWKVRWFRLQQGTLFYYKSPKDKKPIGDITLQNCSVFRSNSKRSYEFTISVPSRDWLFAARDEEEAEQWVEAVKACSTKGSIHYA